MAIRGVREVISELQNFGKDIEKKINLEIEAIAIQVEADAKKLAPKNFGKLAQSISHSKVKDLVWKVTVNEVYGAFLEFGTGTKVVVPAEFADMAKTFKGNKQGTYKQGLESIKVWCRSRGIDEKFAFVIFAKILGAGISPQPYLYPAYKRGEKDLLKNLEKLLKSTNKKI